MNKPLLFVLALWAVAEPVASLPMKHLHSNTTVEAADKGLTITGKPGAAVFAPSEGQAWDVSAWHNASISFTNHGRGVVTIKGELQNPDALSWRNSSPGSCIIMLG